MSAATGPALRIAILVCDVPSEPIPSKYGDYSKLIGNLLRKAQDGLKVDVESFDCRVGQYPADISKYHGVAITGSRYGAYEDFEWIRKLEDYLRQLDAQRVKMLGICFGHQVLAKALGGHVEKNPAGWEMGVTSFPLSAAAKAFFGTTKESLALQYIHQDHVATLPPGAESMGGHAPCPIEGFIKSDYIVALQGHPEFNSGVLTELLHIKEEGVPAELLGDARRRVALPDDSSWVSQQLLRFFLGTKSAHASAH